MSTLYHKRSNMKDESEKFIEGYKRWEQRVMMYGLSRREAQAMVGNGWKSLIQELYRAKPSDIKVIGVKEKWGCLRINIDPYDPIISALLDDIEARSGHICEICGTEGKVRRTKSGWFKALCDTHYTWDIHGKEKSDGEA